MQQVKSTRVTTKTSPWVGQGVLNEVVESRPAYLRRVRKNMTHADVISIEEVKRRKEIKAIVAHTTYEDFVPVLDDMLLSEDTQFNSLVEHQNFNMQSPEHDESLLSEFWVQYGMRMETSIETLPVIRQDKIQVLSAGMEVISE